VNPVPHLGAEDVVDEPVLGNPAEALERGCGDHGIEMMAVAVNFGVGTRNAGFDPFLQLLGSCGHLAKSSEAPPLY
jgi:hypothetical protein